VPPRPALGLHGACAGKPTLTYLLTAYCLLLTTYYLLLTTDYRLLTTYGLHGACAGKPTLTTNYLRLTYLLLTTYYLLLTTYYFRPALASRHRPVARLEYLLSYLLLATAPCVPAKLLTTCYRALSTGLAWTDRQTDRQTGMARGWALSVRHGSDGPARHTPERPTRAPTRGRCAPPRAVLAPP
jgi:hypothetical protein